MEVYGFIAWKLTGHCCLFIAGIECMNCNLLIGEEMALKILKNEAAREKYRQFLFNDEVKVRSILKLISYIN